jgi:hypothetical protein
MSEEMIVLADELVAIRHGVDAFNPDARIAARSAFEAAEQVWKLVPRIITTLRAQSAYNPNERLREALEERVAKWGYSQFRRLPSPSWDELPGDAKHFWLESARSALSPLPQGED